ncbi:unnamed protein product [Caenorhabditis bovis]|uniref:Palmitoyltransferase n=1 Tax=Caenorhabditis bovis TaxID=2654633 RepID=A0A8S1F687_9PELO|nr:unnamed protein product [Caenorhabditis bovis]
MSVASTPSSVSSDDSSTSATTAANNAFVPVHRKRQHGDAKIEAAVKACQIGDIAMVRKVLDENLPPNEYDEEQCTMLHWASINNNVDIIELLIKHGASINKIGGNLKSTPLHWACHVGHLNAIVCLVMNGADAGIRNTNGETAIHVAAHSANSTILAYLLTKFEHLKDARDNCGMSALMIVARESHGMFPIRIFLQFNVFLDFADERKHETALHKAIKRSNYIGAIELIAAGADTTISNHAGNTALCVLDKKKLRYVTNGVKRTRLEKYGTIPQKVLSRDFLLDAAVSILPLLLLSALFALLEFGQYLIAIGLLFISIDIICVIYFQFSIDDATHFPVMYFITMGTSKIVLMIFNAENFSTWYMIVPVGILYTISAILFIWLSIDNSGVIPLYRNPREQFVKWLESDPTDGKFCFTCWVPKPKNSHHCRICNRCVREFDHHCPWVKKCIYRQNLRIFVGLLLSCLIYCTTFLAILIIFLVETTKKLGAVETIQQNGMVIIYAVITVPHIAAFSNIALIQLRQISSDTTTIEEIRKKRREARTETT